jgi:hypothetical protein
VAGALGCVFRACGAAIAGAGSALIERHNKTSPASTAIVATITSGKTTRRIARGKVSAK